MTCVTCVRKPFQFCCHKSGVPRRLHSGFGRRLRLDEVLGRFHRHMQRHGGRRAVFLFHGGRRKGAAGQAFPGHLQGRHGAGIRGSHDLQALESCTQRSPEAPGVARCGAPWAHAPIPLAHFILPLIRANPTNSSRTFHLALDQGKSNVLLKHFHALSDACVDPALTPRLQACLPWAHA